MPVVATSAFNTAGDALQLVRALLADADTPSVSSITASGAQRSGNIVTITTQAAHGLQVGNIVQIGSVSDTSFNGTQTVASVPTSTTFTYGQTAANASSGNGTVTLLVQGDVYTDAVLMPFLQKAYRKVQERMRQAGSKTMTTEAIILNLPIGATSITDSTSPQLPVDFLAPRTVEERISGNPFFNPPMSQVDQLPSVAQGAYNGCYAWYEDGIYFIGATSTLDLRLRYYASFPVPTDSSSVLTVRGCLDAVSSWTAFLAAGSRGAANAAAFAQQFEDDMKDLLNMQAHARQYFPARRRPNNRGRGRFYGYGFGGTV
jgi:hypothetical protein